MHLPSWLPCMVCGLEEELVERKRVIGLQHFFGNLMPHLQDKC